jgi:DNA-binding HxlR family transcriptional regulator
MRHDRYDRHPGCPVEMCTEVIGGKWKGPILYYLLEGTKRFGELRRLLPDVTQRMLTMQLRELEEHGVIERKVYAEVPPKVEYSMSVAGATLGPIIAMMKQWGTAYLEAHALPVPTPESVRAATSSKQRARTPVHALRGGQLEAAAKTKSRLLARA